MIRRTTLLVRFFAALPRPVLAASWITYLATIVWWETAFHPELFLRYGSGKETVYLIGGIMVVLATVFSLCLGSPRSLSWRWGICLILFLWTFYGWIIWCNEMGQRYWTEADFMGHGFGYMALLFLAIFVFILSIILAGLFGLYRPSNWRRIGRLSRHDLNPLFVWLGTAFALFLVFVGYHEGFATALWLLALCVALPCLIELRLKAKTP